MSDSFVKTDYFQEFLDFGYLWMDVMGMSVPTYKPRPENEELWKALVGILPPEFFEVSPMHWLGDLLNREARKAEGRTRPLILAVSLQPGRTTGPERRERDLALFGRFGKNGDQLIADCTDYFQKVYDSDEQEALPITGNQFWRTLARVTFRIINEEPMEHTDARTKRKQCFETVAKNLVQIDLWPLRAPTFNAFNVHVLENHELPEIFKIERRNRFIRDFVEVVDSDVTLLLGAAVTLGENDWIPLPEANDGFDKDNVWRSRTIPKCFRIPHPNAWGMTNNHWDNIGARIALSLQESPYLP